MFSVPRQNIRLLRPPSLAPEDFFILLAFVTRHTKEYLLAHPEYTLTHTMRARLLSCITRRLAHEPIALILGYKEFYGHSFIVNRDTLIPRPETELLIELAQKKIIQDTPSHIPHQKKYATLIDVGTGSGNIILSLARALESYFSPDTLRTFGMDISLAALKIAKKNARALHSPLQTRFIHSDLLIAFPKSILQHSHHLYILANLPYLSPILYRNCLPNVKNYEPATALVSGMHGLAHIIRLLRQMRNIHTQYPVLPIDIWLEISPEQKKLLTRKLPVLLPDARFSFQRDLARKYRSAHISL